MNGLWEELSNVIGDVQHRKLRLLTDCHQQDYLRIKCMKIGGSSLLFKASRNRIPLLGLLSGFWCVGGGVSRWL